MTNNTKALSYDMRERIFWILLSAIIVFGSAYFYAISSTIRHAAMREHLEGEIATLTLDQSKLEFQYIEARNKIDLNLATTRGFKRITSPVYLSRSGSGSLSFNTISR